mgnify:CR=1 FL=1
MIFDMKTMQKTISFFVYSMLAMVCLFTACSDDDDDSARIVQYPVPERMQLSVADNEPVLVKTEAEFDELFGSYASQLPKVDFNKYDLVYGQGASEHGVVSFESWIDGAEPPYRLVVHIQQNLTHEYVRWAVAYLLPKDDNNQVTMAVSVEMAEASSGF